MPSPFPGMDPYLEGNLWSGVHHELAIAVKHQLTPLLLPNYYPFTDRYFVTEDDEVAIVEEKINPDVSIVQEQRSRGRTLSKVQESRGPVILELPEPLPIPHYRVSIRDVDKRRLVAVIEFLSPTNKRGKGREQYLPKREKILRSTVHLVEVDLLRQGQRLPVKGRLPPGAYFAVVSRAQERPKIKVWPINLDEPLPTIPIPLRKKKEGVSLDLQAAFTSVFDQGSYAAIIQYQGAPEVVLPEKDDVWTDQLLRAKGLRR